MTSEPGKQIIAIHILPYFSRSKDNQRINFGQLIEYNMKNIFLEKSYTKCKIFSKIFEEKYETDQVSLSGCLYFVGYWEICALQLFVDQAVTS